MESSDQKQNQSTSAFMKKKHSFPKSNNSKHSEIEPKSSLDPPFKGPYKKPHSNDLSLPHHNPRIWGVAKPIFQSFRDKKIGSFKGFLDGMWKLVSLSEKDPDLRNLEDFFWTFSDDDITYFLKSILPVLGEKALAIEDPKQFPQKIERLTQGVTGIIKLIKAEVSILIVHMFFCTFFTEKGDSYQTEQQTLNKYWNFNKIFGGSKKNPIMVFTILTNNISLYF